MYEDQMEWPRAYGRGVAAAATFMIGVSVRALFDRSGDRRLTLLMIVLLAALFAGSVVVFRRLRIVVDETVMTVGFGPFRERLPLVRIAACDATTYRWWEYGGWGIRHRYSPLRPWGRAKLYNVLGDGGLAVRVALDDGRRVLFSSRDPAAVCRALRARRPDGGDGTSP